MYIKLFCKIIATLIITGFTLTMEAKITDAKQYEAEFQKLLKRKWKQKLFDPGTIDWHKKWFLDGERAIIKNTKDGMLFSGGPVAWDHASHAVLWTRDTFAGDVKIEFDFTRLDTINRWVNIIYIQATGQGREPYVEDIAKWSKLRQIPYMHSYFDHMNLLHISYAAFNNTDDKPDDYVRARRYLPEKNTLENTDLPPDYFKTGLFQPGAEYHFTFIKTDNDLFFEVKNTKVRKLFHWPLNGVKALKPGRIGIRHMWTRCSRYRNISIAN